MLESDPTHFIHHPVSVRVVAEGLLLLLLLPLAESNVVFCDVEEVTCKEENLNENQSL